MPVSQWRRSPDTSSSASPLTCLADPESIDKDGTPAYYRELLHESFDDVLVDELPNELNKYHRCAELITEFRINPANPALRSRCRLPEAHKKALEEDVKAKLESGILRYTSDVLLAASHMVPNHEPDKFRYVQDSGKRNEDTESMSGPMPDQKEVVHKVAKSSNVFVGDMISAFDQTRVDPQDEKYGTIINHLGTMLIPSDLSTEAIGKLEKRIYIVLESSLSGGGGYTYQGENLEKTWPAVYHSRVFTPVQTSYPIQFMSKKLCIEYSM